MLAVLARRLHRVAEAVAAALLAVIFVAFIVQIVARYVFNGPTGWTTELSLAAWLWLVLWGGAFVLKPHEEIRIELLLDAVGPRLRRALSAAAALGVGLLFAVSLPASWKYVSFMRVERTSSFKLPLDFLYSIYLVFAVAVILRCAWQLRMAWRGDAADRPPTPP
jgi:TRAP-type C4-dicarboxylate transport system permease small subunit